MKRVKYFFSSIFNLCFVLASIFVLLNIKYNFFNSTAEPFYSQPIDDFLKVLAVMAWIASFVVLIIWSTLSYNKQK